jgi:hypothetical protein
VASASTKRWLRRLGAGLLFLWWAALAGAHPMPESVVWIDTAPDGLRLTAQLPLNRLEFAFGHTLTDHPETVLARYRDALAAYLLVHVGAKSGDAGWQVLRPALSVTGTRGAEELQATFVLRAPAGADPRAPDLLYDAITHEVRTHRVQVFLRTDWKSGFVGQPPQLIGELDHENNALSIPLGDESIGAGFASLFEGGLDHIADGTDHLLFLLLLLLVAPLSAGHGRWHAMRRTADTLKHTTFVATAFTIGHTVTLVLGSTGVIAPPQRPVEVAVALTIAIAAVHAWRPLFSRAETWMALGFGSIHGLAFSASLSGAGLTPWQHAQALLAFNLGIEAMQLVVLALVMPALLLLGTTHPVWYAHARRALATLAGLMACAWVAQRMELASFGDPAWLADGGTIPLALAALLWLGALAAALLAASRKRKAAAEAC